MAGLFRFLKRFKLVLGIVGGLVTLLIALGIWRPAAVKGAPKPGGRAFTVVVRDAANGRLIARAKVLIQPNALTPATKISDSEGVVSLDLPGSTQAAHITVTAAGYEMYDQEVALWTTAFQDVRLTAVPKKVGKGSASTKPLAPPAGNVVASAPNGIAITGGVVTNPQVQNVYNSPGPVPTAHWTLQMDPKILVESVANSDHSAYHDETYVEGVLTIVPDGNLVHPIVSISCSCRSVEPLVSSNTQTVTSDDGFSLKFREPEVFYAGQPIPLRIVANSISSAHVYRVALGNYP